MRFSALALLFAASSAFAQYSGPALEACRAYAKNELAKGPARADVVLERDQNLVLGREARKLGAQQVGTVLTGNGAIVFDEAPSAELSFICLLADEKRALFFEWLPRRNVSALTQCTRSVELRKDPRPCLEVLHRQAESDIGPLQA
jgi:hypothetical protein